MSYARPGDLSEWVRRYPGDPTPYDDLLEAALKGLGACAPDLPSLPRKTRFEIMEEM